MSRQAKSRKLCHGKEGVPGAPGAQLNTRLLSSVAEHFHGKEGVPGSNPGGGSPQRVTLVVALFLVPEPGTPSYGRCPAVEVGLLCSRRLLPRGSGVPVWGRRNRGGPRSRFQVQIPEEACAFGARWSCFATPALVDAAIQIVLSVRVRCPLCLRRFARRHLPHMRGGEVFFPAVLPHGGGGGGEPG